MHRSSRKTGPGAVTISMADCLQKKDTFFVDVYQGILKLIDDLDHIYSVNMPPGEFSSLLSIPLCQ